MGDLDSVTDEGLAWAARNTEIVRHPADKDQTDTELALALAATSDPERITLIGGGDRLDHTIAGIGALGALHLTSVPMIDGWWDGQHLRVVHGPGSATLSPVPGSTLSLLAMHGPCTNVNLEGTKWPLERFDLDPVVGVGVSNLVRPTDHPPETDAAPGEVTVALSSGVLTIFDEPSDATTDTPTPTVTSTPSTNDKDDDHEAQ